VPSPIDLRYLAQVTTTHLGHERCCFVPRASTLGLGIVSVRESQPLPIPPPLPLLIRLFPLSFPIYLVVHFIPSLLSLIISVVRGSSSRRTSRESSMLLGPPAEPILPCPSDTDFDIFPDPAFVTEGCLMRGKAWRLPVGRSQLLGEVAGRDDSPTSRLLSPICLRTDLARHLTSSPRMILHFHCSILCVETTS
jgi:hypothetical protein